VNIDSNKKNNKNKFVAQYNAQIENSKIRSIMEEDDEYIPRDPRAKSVAFAEEPLVQTFSGPNNSTNNKNYRYKHKFNNKDNTQIN